MVADKKQTIEQLIAEIDERHHVRSSVKRQAFLQIGLSGMP